MRLILIRHGQTGANVHRQLDTAVPGAPLTELGRQQAAELVTALAGEPIEALYVSNLVRTQQTAEPLAEALGLEPQVLDGLREISAGADEMSTDWSNYTRVLANWVHDPDDRLPDGESGTEFMQRYGRAIAQIEADGHECAAVISHGAAIGVFALAMVPSALESGLTAELGNAQSLVLEGSSAEGWRIERWADNRIV